MLWGAKVFSDSLKKKWESWILLSEKKCLSYLIFNFWQVLGLFVNWIQEISSNFIDFYFTFKNSSQLTSLDLCCNFLPTQEEQKFVTWKNNETKILLIKKCEMVRRSEYKKRIHWIVLFLFPFRIHPHFPDRSLYLCSLLFFPSHVPRVHQERMKKFAVCQ